MTKAELTERLCQLINHLQLCTHYYDAYQLSSNGCVRDLHQNRFLSCNRDAHKSKTEHDLSAEIQFCEERLFSVQERILKDLGSLNSKTARLKQLSGLTTAEVAVLVPTD
jgi:hypothetical protein